MCQCLYKLSDAGKVWHGHCFAATDPGHSVLLGPDARQRVHVSMNRRLAIHTQVHMQLLHNATDGELGVRLICFCYYIIDKGFTQTCWDDVDQLHPNTLVRRGPAAPKHAGTTWTSCTQTCWDDVDQLHPNMLGRRGPAAPKHAGTTWTSCTQTCWDDVDQLHPNRLGRRGPAAPKHAGTTWTSCTQTCWDDVDQLHPDVLGRRGPAAHMQQLSTH